MDGSPLMTSVSLAQAAPFWPLLPGGARRQRTLRNAISCVGTGLHSGARAALELRPAPAGTGILFRRTDLGVDIPARHDAVVDTRLCTVLGRAEDQAARIGTVEHLLAALAGCRIDNVVVAVDGPEIPVLDGSAEPFVFLLDCAGAVEQEETAVAIEVLRPVRVESGDAFAALLPGGPGTGAGFDMTMSIDFPAPAIGRQSLSIALTPATFRETIARARTFTLAGEIAALREAGLARGGNLGNAVVVEDARVLNPGGLRMDREFVRHKLLDAIGDLSLAGRALHGRFVGYKSGHALNNRLLAALFADDANWAPISSGTAAISAPLSGWREQHLQAAAAPL